MIGAIALILLLAIGCRYVYTSYLHRSGRIRVDDPEREVAANRFVDGLKALGYWGYADPKDLDELVEDQRAWYDPESTLSTIMDEERGQPMDFRLYDCDGEDVFEGDGILDLIAMLQPAFSLMGFRCDVSTYEMEWDETGGWIDQRVVINETKYTIHTQFSGTGWRETPMRLAQILNIELEKQNVQERVYLIGSGNEGMLVLLTDALSAFIRPFYTNPTCTPQEPAVWGRMVGLRADETDLRKLQGDD